MILRNQLKKSLGIPVYVKCDGVVAIYWGATILAHYWKLEKLFGKPVEADEYKVSCAWEFKDENSGECYCICDNKATNLYDPSLPSVEEFRAATHTWEFDIFGPDERKALRFKGWLIQQLKTIK